MSKNKNRNSSYKGVECQELEKEINGDNHNSPVEPVTIPKQQNTFRIVGSCRLSKTKQSLAIKLNEEGKDRERFVNISRKTLVALFNDENGFSVGNVIEYDNNKQEE